MRIHLVHQKVIGYRLEVREISGELQPKTYNLSPASEQREIIKC